MERYRLKNIIILILVLVNGFLLGSLAVRKTAEHTARRQAAEQLVALFAADSITLDPGLISTEVPPPGRTMARDTALDSQTAAYLLGDGLSNSDQGGGIYTFSSPAGTAQFRANGSFDAEGTLATEDVSAFCRDFCRKFSYSDPVFQLDEAGSGTATATQSCGGLPVFNCTVSFTFHAGTLVQVSGTLLPENYTEVPADQSPLTASAALTAFQETRRETHAAVSAITDLYLCYELQSTTLSPMTLTPSWCVVTDTAKYYVNCNTGAVTSA